MITLLRKYWLVMLGWALGSMIFCDGLAAGSAISEVRIAPDLRRVIIRASGDIGECNAFALDRPPRLVVDIAGVNPGKGIAIPPPERAGGLKVQLAESRSGTHVVLEFGGGPVPAHKIKRMADYLILFLGEWRAMPNPGSGAPSTQSRPSANVFPPTIAAKKGHPVSAASPLSDVKIESVDVVDGLIVLKVTDRRNPDRRFRINLGLNLDRLGFVSAGIYPVQIRQTPPGQGSQQGGAPGSASVQARKAGPRRFAADAAPEKSQSVRARSNSSPGYQTLETRGPQDRGPGKPGGPKRPVGPVSVRDRSIEKPGIVSHFPRVSVAERAQAQLMAYRHSLAAPLAKRCAFSPGCDGIPDFYSALAACAAE